jgi:hypothetical protein
LLTKNVGPPQEGKYQPVSLGEKICKGEEKNGEMKEIKKKEDKMKKEKEKDKIRSKRGKISTR